MSRLCAECSKTSVGLMPDVNSRMVSNNNPIMHSDQHTIREYMRDDPSGQF
jgi:hypothetical protein